MKRLHRQIASLVLSADLLIFASTLVVLAAPPTATDRILKPATCGNIELLNVQDGIFLASQPDTQDFRQLANDGVKTVINLRKDGELDWDEAAVVRDQGMTYCHLPFKAREELTDEVFDRARTLLRDSTKRPILMHCASANRVGALWLAYRVLDDGLTFDAAEQEAKTVGLRTPEYTQAAKNYIERQKEKQQ